MDVIEAAGGAGEAVKSNAEIAKQIQSTNELLNYLVVNLVWIIVFGVIVILGLLVFLVIKNKRDSRKAVLESLETIFGSEGILLEQFISDIKDIKEYLPKIEKVILEEKECSKKNLEKFKNELEKSDYISYNNITKQIGEQGNSLKDILESLVFVKKNNDILSVEFKSFLNVFSTKFDNDSATLQMNINDTIYNVCKKFFENNRDTINELQRFTHQVEHMSKIIECNKEYSDEDLTELLYANSASIIFTIQITMIAAISYPVDELENGKELLFKNINSIFTSCVFKCRNRIKIKNDKIQFIEIKVDKIICELKENVILRLQDYFNLIEKDEVEIIRTIRALNKIFDNSLTSLETSLRGQ